ncbi:MAG: hypothetical protein Q9195_007207 [Heterodermia aff. obscurata]
MSNLDNIIRGHKANLSNAQTSVESKIHSKAVIDQAEKEGEIEIQEKEKGRVVAGLKGTLHNANTSAEAKAHAEEKLASMDMGETQEVAVKDPGHVVAGLRAIYLSTDMGDPFSVAASAVSVVSLGIQVCQGLLSYYDDFKSFDDTINSLCQKIENLRATFEICEELLNTSGTTVSKAHTNVIKNMDACYLNHNKALNAISTIITGNPNQGNDIRTGVDRVDQTLTHTSSQISALQQQISASSLDVKALRGDVGLIHRHMEEHHDNLVKSYNSIDSHLQTTPNESVILTKIDELARQNMIILQSFAQYSDNSRFQAAALESSVKDIQLKLVQRPQVFKDTFDTLMEVEHHQQRNANVKGGHAAIVSPHTENWGEAAGRFHSHRKAKSISTTIACIVLGKHRPGSCVSG